MEKVKPAVNLQWAFGLCMPLVGIAWSFAIFQTRVGDDVIEQIGKFDAFFITAIGGLALTFALWIGVTAVTWAIIRAFGARLSLLKLSTIISAASVPLLIGAPSLAYWLYGIPKQSIFAIISLICFCLFLYFITRSIAKALDWTVIKALAATLATTVFLVSFVTLSV